jgi:hypothetical protein
MDLRPMACITVGGRACQINAQACAARLSSSTVNAAPCVPDKLPLCRCDWPCASSHRAQHPLHVSQLVCTPQRVQDLLVLSHVLLCQRDVPLLPQHLAPLARHKHRIHGKAIHPCQALQ